MEIPKINLDVLKENLNNPRKSIDSQINLYRTLGKLDITLLREGKEYKWEDIKDELISEA